MDAALKVMGFVMVAAIFCVLLRTHYPSMTVLLSLAACIAVLLIGLQFVTPVLDVIRKLRAMTGLQSSLMEPLVKIVGVGVVTTVASGICMDAGESALSRTVEMAGTILSLYLSLPLVLSAIELIEKMMGEVS